MREPFRFVAHKLSFMALSVRFVARKRANFEDARPQNAAKRQGAFAADSSSRASDPSLVIVPGVGW